MQTGKLTMNLDSVRKRAVWAVHADGIFDIVLGIPLLMVALGIVFRIETMDMIAIISFPLVVPLMMALKAKITRPRIGMVEIKPAIPKVTQLLLLTALMVLGIVMMIVVTTVPDGRSVMQFIFPIALPLGLAAYFFVIGRHYNLTRWKILSGALVAIAAIVPFLNITDNWKKGAALLAVGVFLLIGGCVTLANFINKHPVTENSEAA